jgi:hypothetical protein
MQKAPIISHYVSLVVHTQQCTLLKLPICNYLSFVVHQEHGVDEKNNYNRRARQNIP